MEAKDSLTKVLKALKEINSPIDRTLLIQFLVGKELDTPETSDWDDMETFGIGDAHDEDFWNTLLDAAVKGGFLKYKTSKSTYLQMSPTGKSFLKKPKSFELPEEEEIDDVESVEDVLDDFDQTDDMLNGRHLDIPITTSSKSKLQIKIIHAIDRKIALDDLAESEGVALDEVLDELEKLVQQGKKLDITYFTDEVVGSDFMEELLDYFENAPNDDLDGAMDEFGDVSNPEELRLARIVFRVNKQHRNA